MHILIGYKENGTISDLEQSYLKKKRGVDHSKEK